MSGPDRRPVLIGMNNPLSGAAHHALYPHPAGCTGHRIFEMLSERTGCTRSQYLSAFDRRNVLEGRAWDLSAARRAAVGLWESLEGRTVLLLGQPVLAALGLPRSVEPLLWQEAAPSSHPRLLDLGSDGETLVLRGSALSGPERWCLVPHPSGLNRWYNEPAHRMAVALRLEELYESWRRLG